MTSTEFTDHLKLFCVNHFWKLGGLMVSFTLTLGFLTGYSANKGLEGRVTKLEADVRAQSDYLQLIENHLQKQLARAQADGDREQAEAINEVIKLLKERNKQ